MQQGADAASVRLGALGWAARAQLDGFKARVLRLSAQAAGRRWHYEIEWSCATADAAAGASDAELLVIGGVHIAPSAGGPRTIDMEGATLPAGRWRGVVFTVPLVRREVGMLELRVIESALRLLQAHAAHDVAPAVWLCTMATQPISADQSECVHGGLWGFARIARLEHPKLQVLSADGVRDATAAVSSASVGVRGKREGK